MDGDTECLTGLTARQATSSQRKTPTGRKMVEDSAKPAIEIGNWRDITGFVPQEVSTVSSRNTSYYSDRGCRIAPRCLTCPLAMCVEESPDAVAERDRRVAAEFIPHNDAATLELANRYGISTRQVYRIVERGGPSRQAVEVAERWREAGELPAKPLSAIGKGVYKQRPRWPALPVGGRV